MKREHGQHNKKVCDRLHLQDEYECCDWVVTTAFYSAIHFIDHALFPCTYDGKRFNDINEAHKSMRGISRHETRGILVNKHMPQHRGAYTFLSSESRSARYVHYKVNQAIANRAVKEVEAIIRALDKDKRGLPSYL